jgi:hypothetical protein
MRAQPVRVPDVPHRRGRRRSVSPRLMTIPVRMPKTRTPGRKWESRSGLPCSAQSTRPAQSLRILSRVRRLSLRDIT